MNSQNTIAARNRFVGCSDILGFRAALCKLGAEELAHKYNLAIADTFDTQKMEVAHAFAGKILAREQYFEQIELPEVFSDTIMVFTKDASYNSLTVLCHFANTMFRWFLLRKLPLRGAIAYGDVVVEPSKHLFLGRAIVEAYELAESLDSLGVVLSPRLSKSTVREAGFAVLELEVAQKRADEMGNDWRPFSVPVIGFNPSAATDDTWSKLFRQLREDAGEKYSGRYKNSEQSLSAMLNIDPASIQERSSSNS